MSARDVIASVAENKQFQIGAQKADAILSALDAAGYAVVPKNQTAAFLADNVSDEMCDAADAVDDCATIDGLRVLISAALRAAAEGSE